MNEAELEVCRCKLLSLRIELQSFGDSTADDDKSIEPDIDYIGGRSRMDAMLAQQKGQDSVKMRKRQIQKIEGALRRIEAGEYGRCFVCEEELDLVRLSADPTITRCMKCIEE
jgi:DnaK suppressor protein